MLGLHDHEMQVLRLTPLLIMVRRVFDCKGSALAVMRSSWGATATATEISTHSYTVRGCRGVWPLAVS